MCIMKQKTMRKCNSNKSRKICKRVKTICQKNVSRKIHSEDISNQNIKEKKTKMIKLEVKEKQLKNTLNNSKPKSTTTGKGKTDSVALIS